MTVPAVLHPFTNTDRPSDAFLEVVRGEGSRVFDVDGKSYIDGTASLWYCAVGHGRDEIADAVSAQMRQLSAYHVFARFTNQPQDDLATMIRERAPMGESRVLFTAGGSESVDSAMKIIRAAHRRSGQGQRTVFLSRHSAYHGVMYGGISTGGLPHNRNDFTPLVPDCFQVDRDSLDAMREAIAYYGPDRIAAIMTEPVQGAGGVYPPAPGYLEGLRELCDECGALLMFDEVITGFGRLGTWFGAQYFGVTPDVITFAKAVTSGYLPLGGVIVGDRVRAALESEEGWMLRHGTTYSGHPAACAAGIANLEIFEREGLLERAAAAGPRLRSLLEGLADRPGVAGVRGEGLMQALVLERGEDTMPLSEALLRQGVIGRAIPHASALAFSPPLGITDDELDEIAAGLDAALGEIG
jgi:adenosylmethionine-8-amino-7-oxononanoate aminotransferase